MRVCPASGSDTEGNHCNWTTCGYGSTQNGWFGGCMGNLTAGTLCQERTISFTTPSGAVVLQSPANGATAPASHVTLVFGDNGADSYSVELTSTQGQYELPSGEAAPGAVLYQVEKGSACSNGVCTFELPNVLSPGTRYYWRVQGFLLSVPGAWSNNGSDWSFTTLSQ
jgi:hypothetical protein